MTKRRRKVPRTATPHTSRHSHSSALCDDKQLQPCAPGCPERTRGYSSARQPPPASLQWLAPIVNGSSRNQPRDHDLARKRTRIDAALISRARASERGERGRGSRWAGDARTKVLDVNAPTAGGKGAPVDVAHHLSFESKGLFRYVAAARCQGQPCRAAAARPDTDHRHQRYNRPQHARSAFACVFSSFTKLTFVTAVLVRLARR